VERAALELVEYVEQQFDAEVVEVFLDVLKDEGKLSARQVRDLKRRMGGRVSSVT
jgi:hypothetical protein